MTPKEFEDKRRHILQEIAIMWPERVGDFDPYIVKLADLDKEYRVSQSSPYYTFVNRHDELWHSLKSFEGESEPQATMCDAIAQLMIEWAQMLRGEQEESETDSDLVPQIVANAYYDWIKSTTGAAINALSPELKKLTNLVGVHSLREENK